MISRRGAACCGSLIGWEHRRRHDAVVNRRRARSGPARGRSVIRSWTIPRQAVLERAEQPLDAPLGLRRVGRDRGDPQGREHVPELGRVSLARQLFLQRLFLVDRTKDAMPVMVDRHRHAVAGHHLLKHLKVAVGVFLEPEDRPDERAGRVIDRGDDTQSRTTLLQPGVGTGIELEEETRLRHPLPALPMLWRAAGSWARHPTGAQDTAD